jgi:hypothetical protein
MDERSQRLLQGGAASRSWADTAARETVRNEPGGSAAAATSAYSASGGGQAPVTPSSGTTASAGALGGATSAAGRTSQPRRARLRISHLSPMSVLKLSLLLGACLLVVLLVAVAALWFVLDSAGVFSSITEATSTITDSSGGGTTQWFSFGRVMLITVVLGVFNVLALTLLATVSSLLYNLCSDFVGGVEVTLSER